MLGQDFTTRVTTSNRSNELSPHSQYLVYNVWTFRRVTTVKIVENILPSSQRGNLRRFPVRETRCGRV